MELDSVYAEKNPPIRKPEAPIIPDQPTIEEATDAEHVDDPNDEKMIIPSSQPKKKKRACSCLKVRSLFE